MLICLGATVYFLRLRNAETLEQFKLRATLNRAYRALDIAIGGRGRMNARRHIDKTTLLPTHLPVGLYKVISAYSVATGVSKNALLSRFLEVGLILYMLGQETLLKTVVSLEPGNLDSSMSQVPDET
jgi:hypothetical protein